MAYIAATLNPEILKNFPGPVRVGKKKSGSGRVAGTRQGLVFSNEVYEKSLEKKCFSCVAHRTLRAQAIAQSLPISIQSRFPPTKFFVNGKIALDSFYRGSSN